MLARVHVEHELRDRAMQVRDLALQDDEAAAGELRGRIEVDEPELLAERNVIERLERELRRSAPSPQLDVRGRVGAVGNRRMQQVREPGKKLVELAGERSEPRLAGAELFAERADLAFQRVDVAACGFGAADRFRALVARLA